MMALDKFGRSSNTEGVKRRRLDRCCEPSLPINEDGDYDFSNRKLSNVKLLTKKTDTSTKGYVDNIMIPINRKVVKIEQKLGFITNNIESFHGRFKSFKEEVKIQQRKKNELFQSHENQLKKLTGLFEDVLEINGKIALLDTEMKSQLQNLKVSLQTDFTTYVGNNYSSLSDFVSENLAQLDLKFQSLEQKFNEIFPNVVNLETSPTTDPI
ncbi:hypothetical protein WA026_019832 [Henosepilachna vigintioctopunctata]|uniref:Uncharacterized protein n=1 Tax=Henosepilachna vigintioctopunctata TaxID=420089 RepID=A0AAW1VEN4_9CUCU